MKPFYLLLVVGVIFNACSPKDHATPPPPFNPDYALTNQPEADAANDQSNYGIYKGVVINAQDSTATFKFNLYNHASQPYGLFYTLLKVQDSLVRYMKDNNGLIKFPLEQDTAMIPLNANFYYTYFSSYRNGFGPLVGFNVTAHGATYVMDAQLYNNQTLNAILKETSTKQVFCYEGNYGGADSGRIAFVHTADSIVAIRASISSPQFFHVMKGAVVNNHFSIDQVDDISGLEFTFTGTLLNNVCTGTWTKFSVPGVENPFTAKRTL